MLIRLLTTLFAGIIIFIGFYLHQHQKTDFMLFKPSSNSVLSGVIKNVSIALIVIGIICLLLGLIGNTYLTLAALFLGMIATTSALLVLIRFV